MIIDYILYQLKTYWRKPLWLLVTALLALPITMLIQLSVLKADLLSAGFISSLKNKAAQTILLTDQDSSQALPLLLSQEAIQRMDIPIAYERSFNAFAKLADRHQSVQVSAFSGGFAEFGITALLGNLAQFQSKLLQNSQIAVLSYQGWQRLFNKDLSVIGDWVSINGQQYQIIAVLDKSFLGFRQQFSTDFIIPFAGHHLGDGDVLPDTISYILQQQLAENELRSVVKKMRDEFLLSDSQSLITSAAVGIPVAQFNTLTQRITLLQWLIILLLIFCVLAYLGILISEQQQRHNEFQLRLMLGASQHDLQLQRWVELTLNGIFLVIVCCLYLPAMQNLMVLLFPDVRIDQLSINLQAGVLILITAISLVALGLLFYALQDRTMVAHLGRGQTQSFWQRRANLVLVAMQLSLAAFSSFITLVLLLQQLNIFNTDLGFKPQNLHVLTFDPLFLNGAQSYNSDLNALFQQLKQNSPGQEVAAAIVTPLTTTYMFGRWTTSSGHTVGNVNGGGTYTNRVSFNYFDVMQTPLLFGRLFYPQASNEIVVNRALWQRYFQDSSLLGANLQYNGENYRVVGVADNILYQGPDQPAEPVIYQPLTNLFEFTQLLIRSEQALTEWQEDLLASIKLQHPLLSAEPISFMPDKVEKEHAQRLSLLVLMFVLSIGGIVAAVLFTYTSIRQMLAASSTELALRFSMGARLIQLIKHPLLVLVALQLTLVVSLHLIVTPRLNLGAESSWQLLVLVIVISILFISALLLLMYRHTIQNSWQYLTK